MPDGRATGDDPKSYALSYSLGKGAWWLPGAAVPQLTPEMKAAIERVENLAARYDAQDPQQDFALAIEGVDPLFYPPPGVFHFQHFPEVDPDLDAKLKAVLAYFQELGITVDFSPGLRMSPADSWCPKEAPFPHLGSTALAREQISAATGASGENVYVVVVDQGINAAALKSRVKDANFGGGWRATDLRPGAGLRSGDKTFIEPGQWPDGHGTRMAELVLSVAPKATILDLPLLPPRIRHLRGFLPWAAWVYWSLQWIIPYVRSEGRDWPWVICNAWSVYDLRSDFYKDPRWSYGANPESVLNRAVSSLSNSNLADIVFAAGNNGQFCPDSRAAPDQIGPGRSIYGAAALNSVLTVGAVRNEETWLGYSAQGPSPENFNSQKPDLVAPSQFTATNDAARGYSGTSAACALAAGAMAAARSLPQNKSIPARHMLERAINTARPLRPSGQDRSRVGAGMLHVPGLLNP